MKVIDLFIEEIEREAASTRKVLEKVPEGRDDWKPHEKSMPMGYLVTMVATMPSWVGLVLNQDELDLAPVDGPKYAPPKMTTVKEWTEALDKSVATAREVLAKATEEDLLKSWNFKIAGRVVSDLPKHVAIRDSIINHWAHHRGQLTVYLRLNEQPVPAI